MRFEAAGDLFPNHRLELRACPLGEDEALVVGHVTSPVEHGKHRFDRRSAAAFRWTSASRSFRPASAPSALVRAGALFRIDDERALLLGTKLGERAVGLRSEGDDSAHVTPLVYEAASDAWVTGTPQSLGRTFWAATLLADGSALFVGGRTGEASARVDRYTPSTDTWRRVTDAPTACQSAKVSTLADGRVLVAIGHVGKYPSKLTQVYEPHTDTWKPSGALVDVRDHATFLSLPDGRVAVFGGNALGKPVLSIETLDPETLTWKRSGVLGHSRDAPAATLLPDGRVLVSGGGYRGPADSPEPVWHRESTEIWDPETGKSIEGPPMTVARTRHQFVAWPSGRALLVGGRWIPLTQGAARNPAIQSETLEIDELPGRLV